MLLLSPGPGICDTEVLSEIAKPCIHHRSEPFKQLYQEIVKDMKALVHAPNGEVIVMNGSGSYGMEGAIRNLLTQGDTVLSIRCGYFGDRFYQMAKQHGCILYSLLYPKYKTYDEEDVAWMLQQYSIKALLVTHSESDTGTLQDLWKLGRLCQQYNVLLIVDSISGVVMNEIDMEAMHIDCLIMASQKGFLMPPGLSMSVLSQKAIALMNTIQTNSYVFDYKTMLTKFYHDARIHSTPSIPLFRGLHIALQKLNQKTNAELAKHYQKLHQYVKQELQKMQFQCMAEGIESNSILVCKVPNGKHASHIQQALEKRGVRIELGLQDDEDEILRIGIMNAVQKKDLIHFIAQLHEVLYET